MRPRRARARSRRARLGRGTTLPPRTCAVRSLAELLSRSSDMLTTLTLLSTLVSGTPASGGNDSWPGWRGNGSGVASGAPPIEWSASENVRWKTPVPGKGLSSPVIWDGLVFVTTSVGTGKKQESAPAEAGSDGERGRPEGGRGGGEGGGEGGERGGRGEGGRGEGGRGEGGRGPGGGRGPVI